MAMDFSNAKPVTALPANQYSAINNQPNTDQSDARQDMFANAVPVSKRLIDPKSESIERYDPNNPTETGGVMRRLGGMEQSLAAASPTAYATMRFAADFVPYAPKLLFPSVREEFVRLTPEEQRMSLLWDALGAALIGRGGALATDAKYLAGVAGKGVSKAITPFALGAARKAKWAAQPVRTLAVEDAMAGITKFGYKDSLLEFSYAKEAKRQLLKQGFSKIEAGGIAKQLEKGNENVVDILLDKQFKGKKSSAAFDRLTEWKGGTTYPTRVLTGEVRALVDETALRSEFYTRAFEKVLARDVLKIKPERGITENILKTRIKRVYPELEGRSLGEFAPDEIANITLDMLENRAVTWRKAMPMSGALRQPARYVFGKGEELYGTYKKIYIPIKQALARTNKYFFNKCLLWSKMCEQRGIYSSVKIKATGEFVAKKAGWVTPKVLDEVTHVLKLMDDTTMQLTSGKVLDDAARETLQNQLIGATKGASRGARVIIDAWRSYSDHLYADHMRMQIPRLFEKAGLTDFGKQAVNRMMHGQHDGLHFDIDRLFSTAAATNSVEKISGIKQVLEKVVKRLEFAGENHPYFKADVKKLPKLLEDLKAQLDYETKGFLNYHENYVARISQKQDTLVDAMRQNALGSKAAAYTKERQLMESAGKPVQFEDMLQSITLAHAKEQFLYDTLEGVGKMTKRMPNQWAEYINDYTSGVLGIPTVTDYKLAAWLTKTAGSIETLIGKQGIWDDRRVLSLAHSLNSLGYLGGLAFRPATAMRGAFQPLVTVAADLGEIRDIATVMKGYKWALNKANRKYVIDLGIIDEYIPELSMRPRMMPRGTVIAGKELPSLDRVRDVGLWMFKGAERYSRYTAAGAAVLKWDKVLKTWGGRVSPKSVEAFASKIRLGNRKEVIQAEIKDFLYRGKMAEAKAAFVRDVVADTQYLYGVADAPVIFRKYGAVSRTAGLFQSWWTNYAALLEKWLTTGASPGAKVESLFTMMLSQSIAYTSMATIWGKSYAARSTFFGPIPSQMDEFLIPPVYKPFYHLTAALLTVTDPEVALKQLEKGAESLIMFAPGGLQIRSSVQGIEREGFKGFSKSIIGAPTHKQ